jgi:hypothetical protein
MQMIAKKHHERMWIHGRSPAEIGKKVKEVLG